MPGSISNYLFFLFFILVVGQSFSQLTSDNLVAYYPLDGDVLDYGPNGYHGMMNGGMFVADAEGVPSSALRLDGINDYVDLTSFALDFRDNLDQMTIYFLVKYESAMPNQTILSLGNYGELFSNNVFEIEFENNQFQVETEVAVAMNVELEIDQAANIVDQNWHEVFIQINGNQLKYCRDGQLVYDGLYIPAETSTNELFLGCFDGDGSNACCHMNGVVDELQFYSSLSLLVNDTLQYSGCESDGYSIAVNNTLYDINNPTGNELIQSDCFRDTILFIDLNFLPVAQSTFTATNCASSNFQVEINNTIYDINNPNGIEVLSTVDGCDSTILVNLSFLTDYDFTIAETHCEDGNYQLEVNNTIYDINNPTGVEVLSAINGCDSTIVVDLNFVSDYFITVAEIHCENENYQLEVNQTIYDINNPTGSEMLSSVEGCDSTVFIDLSFIPDYNFTIAETHCESENYQLEVNQAIYDINNPTGIEVLSTVDGCDSTIVIDLNFVDDTADSININLCAENNFSIEVNGTLYNADNPNGVEVFELDFCDSTVVVDLVFNEITVDTLSHFGCIGDQFAVTINNVLYNENNPQGMETLQNQAGCDSLVYINLNYSEAGCDMYFPNVINTNSDFPNNVFQLFTATDCSYDIDTFLIFDRWGSTVYGTSEKVEWDGMVNGKQVEQGVYVYYSVIDTPCGKVTKTGSFLVLNK